MPADSQFSVVASNFPVSDCLLTRRVPEGLQLIGWRDHHIYISVLADEQINESTTPNPLCNFDQLIVTGFIKGLFCFEDVWYVVDSEGILYILKKDTVQGDYDDDLFEDSPKYILRWQLHVVTTLIDKGEILTCCKIKNGIASVAQQENNIILNMHYLNNQNSPIQITIHKYEGPVIKRHKGTYITFIDEEDVSMDFIRHWFPENAYSSGGIIIIALPETIVCGIFANENIARPYFFFNWPFRAVHIDWKSLSLQGGESSRYNYLLIIFDGGSIVALGPYGEYTLHYPLNNVKNLYVSRSTLFSTNFSDCFSSSISQTSEGVMLPIKGAVGFCEIPNSNNILISTRHRVLYNLNPEMNKTSVKFKIPQLSLLDELLQSADYMEQLSHEIKLHDKYINALAYSVNGANFKFDFSIKIISIAGNKHTLRVLLETDTPGIKFASSVWHLALSVSSSEFDSSLIQELQSDFSEGKPLEQLFNLDIDGTDRFIEVHASLISFLVAGKYRPTIYIGKKNINITYFLQSVSTIPFHTLHMSQKVNMRNVWDSWRSKDNSDTVNEKEEQNQKLCRVRVPLENDKMVPEIFTQLVNNSKSLWRTAEWDSIDSKNLIELAIGTNTACIELKESFVEITSDEIHICYQLKLALITLLSPSFKVSANESVLMEVENILKALEILEYQKEEIDMKLLKHLFRRKKRLISDNIFQVETKIATISEEQTQ